MGWRKVRPARKFSAAALELRKQIVDDLKQGERPNVDDVPQEVFDEAFGKITNFESAHAWLLRFNDLLKKSTNNRLIAQFCASNLEKHASSFAVVGFCIEISSYRGTKHLRCAPAHRLRRFSWTTHKK